MLILLVASFPGLIIGFCTYWIATDKLEGELQRLHIDQIDQGAAVIDDQLNYLELTMSHWAFDPKFEDEKLKTLNIGYDFEQVKDLYRTLLLMEGTHPFLQKVQLFLNEPRPVLFSTERFTYIDQPGDAEIYSTLLNQKKSAFWTNQYGTEDTIALVNKIPGGSLKPFGMIIATINTSKLIQSLKTLTPTHEGVTLLLNKNGGLEMSTSGKPFSRLEEALKQEYEAHSSSSESFLFPYKDKSYSVSYGQFNRLGATWVYISATPLSSIVAPVVMVSKWILYISLTGLTIALLMSSFVLRRIYSPVERLVALLTGGKGSEYSDEFDMFEVEWKHLASERELLHSKLKEQLPVLREGFFLQLAQGYLFALGENEIKGRIRHYGWENDNVQYVALMFRLTGFSGLEGRFSLGDEDLVTYATANIVDELARKQYEQAEVINFHNFSIGLLLALPSDQPVKWLNADLDLFCRELMRTINHIIRMQVTVAISKSVYSVKQIPHIFEEVRQAMAYRELIDDDNQILWTEELAKSSLLMECSYPFSLDKEIINAIRSGLEETAGELISQFMDDLSANGSTEFYIQQGMLQLLGSIRYAALQSGMNPVRLFGSVNLFDELAGIKERDEMQKWFRHKVVKVLVQEMISRQDYHLKHIIEKVILFLNEQYMTGLSLESCADRFETSPYTLSRAFKQIAGINFIDYLTDIRIRNAKLLLLDPDLKINEVAEKVGYQHSYFNRIFKKYEGITPSSYRELNRQGK
ncbi:AraC family transcriptional regulator [Paenibacillus sepulcri]|uniref:AraC family transcriptional regulator n=1 Tax=Paenibacillus sepulcri TaxID=359917 RepID=A0ABS7C3F1_9BACL|nr:AraC family transcriptional regulator [Paenibacillus sepulcri]